MSSNEFVSSGHIDMKAPMTPQGLKDMKYISENLKAALAAVGYEFPSTEQTKDKPSTPPASTPSR